MQQRPFESSTRTRDAKILDHEELLAHRKRARAAGKSVVQCHGCFDIVHPGHIRHLRQAKSQGDVLLVTITGDSAWTKRDGAPLIPQELRAENLAELDCVDWVYVEKRPTAAELLAEVKPDVYVKGREYEHNADPRFAAERAAVESAGGRVVFSSGDVVFSSTALIAALERSADPYHGRLSQLLGREDLEGGALTSVVGQFRGKRVMVVGETILDTYVLCDQPEVAAESPVMTLRPLEKRRYDGGAAIIARHLAALGAKPVLVTGVSADAAGQELRERLVSEGVEVVGLSIDQEIAEKQRFLVGTQKVMKLNNFQPLVLDAKSQDRLVELAAEAASGCDGAIVADFGNGLLSPGVVERVSERVRVKVGVMAGDVSGPRAALKSFRNFDLLAPSESEARGVMRRFDESMPVVAWELMEETAAKHVFITLGGDGLIAFERVAEAAGNDRGDRVRVRGEHVPAMTSYPVDPLGCGDALLAAATLALTTGANPVVAAFLGSLAAATEAQRLGNVPVTATDLRHGIVRLHTSRLMYAPAEAGVRMERKAS